jgi:putative exporter of polyketide antibiotics
LVLLPEQSTLLFFGASLSLGLGLGASVLAFPLAEDAAPRGQTAFTVATVNTTGTVTGAVMAVVSGQILQSSAPGNLTAVLVVYGLLALFGVAVATWVEVTLQPQR